MRCPKECGECGKKYDHYRIKLKKLICPRCRRLGFRNMVKSMFLDKKPKRKSI